MLYLVYDFNNKQ